MVINERINFERILCPLDLNSESGESLRYGIALAKAYSATLLLINCMNGHSIDRDGERERIKALLDEAVRNHLGLPVSADLSWESLVVAGDPKTAIAHEAAERRVDLIVMQSRRRPYAAALLGSTAESVCRTAPCPVMVTHPFEQNRSEPESGGRVWAGLTTNDIDLQRVLVAYDFSSDSELALSYGVSLAQEYQAQLH